MAARSKDQQVRDAIWYLRKAGQSPEDEAKAIAILEEVVGDPGLAARVECAPQEPAPGALDALRGVQLAVCAGHEPGGGAPGEREWNTLCAREVQRICEGAGAEVYRHEHLVTDYGRRQQAYAAAVRRELPSCLVCLELHYDDVANPAVSGHHFQFRGAKALAVSIRDVWQSRYPHSKPRYSAGIMRNLTGNGSGFLKEAPGWACLTEPFFRSNPSEWEFYRDRHTEVAEIYAEGVARFAATMAATPV